MDVVIIGIQNLPNIFDIEAETNKAEALSFIYVNDDYGFKPSEVFKFTCIPEDVVHETLEYLYDSDLIGKTWDGYYHALDDPYIRQVAETLEDDVGLDYGKSPYPEDMHKN